MKASFLFIGLAAAFNIKINLSNKSLCTPTQVQSIKYELDWNNGPDGSGKDHYSLQGACLCHNAQCSQATCTAQDKSDGAYMFCKQISGGDCGMDCAYIDDGECPDEDAKCPGFATVPVDKGSVSGEM